MLTFVKQIFTWWNHQTLGTRLHTILFGKFKGKDNFGNNVPSGVYVYRLQSEFHSETRKMTLLK